MPRGVIFAVRPSPLLFSFAEFYFRLVLGCTLQVPPRTWHSNLVASQMYRIHTATPLAVGMFLFGICYSHCVITYTHVATTYSCHRACYVFSELAESNFRFTLHAPTFNFTMSRGTSREPALLALTSPSGTLFQPKELFPIFNYTVLFILVAESDLRFT